MAEKKKADIPIEPILKTLNSILKEISGQDLGQRNYRAWEEWLEKQK
ncbi:MAG: hypothetical protein MUD14_24080 [Hydrococcus sp. Prado102]|jgi:hypothetical protein|nr:hypothetical protein [Hydrococcus sp. Prado102]